MRPSIWQEIDSSETRERANSLYAFASSVSAHVVAVCLLLVIPLVTASPLPDLPLRSSLCILVPPPIIHHPRPVCTDPDFAPVKVGGGIPAPKIVKFVQPVYPRIAEVAGIQGTVKLEVTTDACGQVADIRVLESVPLLDSAAVEAVQQWKYAPTSANGHPVPVVLTAVVRFKLPGVGDWNDRDTQN